MLKMIIGHKVCIQNWFYTFFQFSFHRLTLTSCFKFFNLSTFKRNRGHDEIKTQIYKKLVLIYRIDQKNYDFNIED